MKPTFQERGTARLVEHSGKIKNFIRKKILDHMELSQTAFTIVASPVSRLAHFYIIVIQVE